MSRPVRYNWRSSVTRLPLVPDPAQPQHIPPAVQPTREDVDHYLDHFRTRVLQDAIASASASTMRRRAEAFAGGGTGECDQIAQALRNAAQVALFADPDPEPTPPCCEEAFQRYLDEHYACERLEDVTRRDQEASAA